MGSSDASADADAANQPARARRAARPVPALLSEHAHLQLQQLRDYRSALHNGQRQVPYWRAVLKARLDAVRDSTEAAASGGTRNLDATDLRPALLAEHLGVGRTALLQIVAGQDLPPLPDLNELWTRPFDSSDQARRAQLESDLLAAASRLSDYRGALLRRLEQATGELMARYREDPSQCLSALPLPPAWPGQGPNTSP